MQSGGVEVGSIRPNQCVDLRVDSDLVKDFHIVKRRVQLTEEHRPEVNGLSGVIIEMNPECVGRNDFDTDDAINWMTHSSILTVRWAPVSFPVARFPSPPSILADAIRPKLRPVSSGVSAKSLRSVRPGR